MVLSYEAQTLLELGVSWCWTCIGIRHRHLWLH